MILTASCLDEPDCYQLHNDVLGVTFRVIGTGAGDSVLFKNFLNGGKDQVITSFNVKLNYFTEEGVLDFERIEGTNFLQFGYTVKNQFISEECGSSFELSNLHILAHDFDSARIFNATPSKTGGTNIEVYRCPETDTLMLVFNQLSATTNGVTIANRTSGFISHQFDSILLDGSGSVFSGRAATVKLPVYLDKNEVKYFFKTDAGEDSLTITYDRVTEERYRACGIQTFVNNLEIVQHSFDSINFSLDSNDEPVRALLDPQIANLRIYDCPKTNLLQVAFLKGTAAQTVTIKSIKADHVSGDLLDTVRSVSSIVLPVDLNADVSNFYIQYQDDTIDTLSVRYTRTGLTLFNACGDSVVTGLSEVTDQPNVQVVANRGTLQFPPVTNVQITVD
jgi:hypothetical protein